METLRDLRDGLDPTARRVLFRLGDRYVRCSKVVDDEDEYDALVELTQRFRTRYPLVQGLGNFGSIDDDPPADAEYTEARLAPIAHALPRFPNLLINGAPGIPPHNLREVAAGDVLGPDYPTGGVIVQIVKLVHDRRLTGIVDIQDRSDRDGMRL